LKLKSDQTAPNKALNDEIAECEFMIAYHEVDLQTVGSAKDLSPVGEELARQFVANKLKEIGNYRACLKLLHQRKK
jgi:hypothetical protein